VQSTAASEQDPGPPLREIGDEIVQVVGPNCGRSASGYRSL
jgi:hypothetical protein